MLKIVKYNPLDITFPLIVSYVKLRALNHLTLEKHDCVAFIGGGGGWSAACSFIEITDVSSCISSPTALSAAPRLLHTIQHYTGLVWNSRRVRYRSTWSWSASWLDNFSCELSPSTLIGECSSNWGILKALLIHPFKQWEINKLGEKKWHHTTQRKLQT